MNLLRILYRMAKSLRSKRKQKIKRVRREKYGKVEAKKCWDKHLAIQAEKTEDMVTEGGHYFELQHVCHVGGCGFRSASGL